MEMNTTATWYRGTGSSPWPGQVGYDGGALVGRFAFTTPATGASELSWTSATLNPRESTTWSQSDRAYSFRWAVTASDTEHIGRVSAGVGFATGADGWDTQNLHMDSGGVKSVQLLPNTTYYLWIFPSGTAYNHWLITSVAVTLSGSYGAPAVPTASDGFFGSAIGVTLSGATSLASYTVTVACAGRTETLLTRGMDTYLTWTPSTATYAPLVTTADSASATITVETFYGAASIGTRSASITLRFRPEDVAPILSAGWYSHAPYNETQGSAIAKYIAGISRASVSFDATKISPQYGAAIASYSVSCGGVTDDAAPYRTPILTGASTVTVAVTDSRGVTSSESFTITPLPYAAPSLGQVSVFRCDAQGSADEDGSYISASATAIVNGLDGANSAAILLYRKTVSGSYGSGTALQSGVASVIGGMDPDVIYDVKIEITDTVGNSGAVTRRLTGRAWALRFRANGQGVGFGMAPQADKRLQLPADWSVYVGTDRLLPQTYAVGDIFVTTRSGNPAALLGYGTWSQIKDRFLLAAGDSYTAGDTGGEASHTLTTDEMPAHAGHLHANSGFPNGVGDLTGKYLAESSLSSYGAIPRGWNQAASGEAYPAGADRGGGQAHNNMPPYLVVYMWLRTA